MDLQRYIMRGLDAKAMVKLAAISPSSEAIPMAPSVHFSTRLRSGKMIKVPNEQRLQELSNQIAYSFINVFMRVYQSLPRSC